MSDQRPTRFDPYPFSGEAEPSPAQPPAPAPMQTWAGSAPPTGRGSSSGVDRRRLIGRVLGIGALILIAGQVWRPGESVPTTWPSATGSAVADEEAPPEEVTFGDAEEFTVSVPNGWQVEDSSGTSVLISRDGTSLFARSYLAGEDAVASDEARRMATRYASGVKRTGKASTTAEDGPGGLARGSYHSAGTVDGRQVQVYADVLIRPEDTQAVAVVTILRGDADADVAQQLAAMRDEVLGQL